MPTKPLIITYGRVAREAREALAKDFRVVYYTNNEYVDDDDFASDLRKAIGIIGLGLKVNETLLEHAPHLKVVSNVSVGYDNLDLDALTKRNIAATNTPGVLDDTTADLIFGLLLTTARRISELDRFVKEGQWKDTISEAQYGFDVHHKTLGIIGMGRIGKAIAKRARFGFDMDILYYNRNRNREAEIDFNAVYTNLDELLSQSDFVCLMTPLTKETKHLIGKQQFKQMKRSAFFINGSRGATVDEDALVEALAQGEINGAGLDVFQQEPIDSDHPLLKFPNVVTTPHIGSSTYENERNMSELAVKNARMAISGKRPPHLINSSVTFK